MRRLNSFFIITAMVAMAMMPAMAKGREFRGAWLHTVHQEQYSRQSTEENKQYLRAVLDSLQKAGINAVLFQVRPSADAFYKSDLEPWSRFLSGKAGVAPSPMWDPLQFMIDECHSRGMELHAWLNPYRVTTSKNEKLPEGHLYYSEPQRFISYDGRLYFDPGQPENRRWITDVVTDIVSRYKVDGIHFDDYFYPYPVSGLTFDDAASYKKYGDGMKLADWRRKNVDLLIEEIHYALEDAAPDVEFGISPFGIWRNKASDPNGSDTNGLQNYDDLYADVILWAREGWIDYLLPQLYWVLDHKRASSRKLLEWWATHTPDGCALYIGQDLKRSMDTPELREKVELSRSYPAVSGNCWWPGYLIYQNYDNCLPLIRELNED